MPASEQSYSGKTAVIMNPRAAAGRAGRSWPAIEAQLRDALGDIEVMHTEYAQHGVELTRGALRSGFDLIIGAGGDGTYSDVANGFIEDGKPISPTATMAVLPCGTGSDFARMLGIESVGEGIGAIKNGGTMDTDLGTIEFTDANGDRSSKYFLNICDFGMGGAVVEKVNQRGGIYRGKLGYLMAILATLATYRVVPMRITVDGDEIEGRFSSVIMANGEYFGNGIHVARDAKMNDGLIDVIGVRETSPLSSLRNMPKLYDGSFVELTDLAVHVKGREITAAADDDVYIDLDGEWAGRLPLAAGIMPAALKLAVPASFLS